MSFPGIRSIRLAAACALGMFGLTMVGPVPAVQAGSGDAQAREVVRLINGARATSGKRALTIDLYLAGVATDGAIPCPDTSGSLGGRTRDFASTGKMDHLLRDCGSSGYQVSDVMFVNQLRAKMGYGSATVGEIIGVNGGFGTGRYTFTYRGWSSYTYGTTGHIVSGWLQSSTHASIIMGNYTRVGCGAWWQGGSTIYYDCIFAVGGPAPSGTTAAPGTSPFGPMPTPAPTAPPPPAPTAAPTHCPTQPPSGGAGGTGTGSGGAATDQPSPGASATPTPTPEPTATPGDLVAGATSATALGSSEVAAVLLPTPAATGADAAANTMPPERPVSGRDGLLTPASILVLGVGLILLAVVVRRRRQAAQTRS